jgi:tRNA (cmo5U34)-methyltransferase
MYDKYNWRFDKSVVDNFDSHVRMSVPFYEIFHKSLIDISKYYIRRNSDIIDVGTSTGYFIKNIYDEKLNRNNKFIGVDIEDCMIQECKKRYKDENIDFMLSDAMDIDYSNSSIVSLILLLQFLENDKRIELLKKIYKEIKNNTALLIVEKVKCDNIDLHDIYNDLYYDFKRECKLSDTDILDKNVSLRGIMKPIFLKDSIKILEDIGFKVDINVKYNNFVSLIAVK